MKKRRSGAAARSKPNKSGMRYSTQAGGSETFFSPRDLACMALIFCLTLIAYLPALHGTLLWDDAGHLTAPALQSPGGLWRIWFELGTTQQYYPLLHSAFWFEHQLWGDNVFGYHLTNVLLHCISAILLVWIVRRLRLPGAWLAGFLFALHPVCVESVAWISEQKNTLSAVFYLASAFIYLRFDETRKTSHYLWAAALFVLALLSKSVTATLPAALLVVLWWRHGKIQWKRDFSPLAPWLGAGIAAGLFTSWVEKTYIGAQGADFSLTLLQRGLLAGRVVWFYLAKLVWPSNLSFIYPRFNIDVRVWWQYLFPAGLLALLVCLWLLRSRFRGPLAGLLYFVGTLFPVLGFLNVFPFIYSYVADHFQYLACLGILVPAAAGLATAAAKLPPLFRDNPTVKAAGCGLLLLGLTMLTWRQSAVYANAETLWRTTIARNPASSMAYNNLGDIMFRQSRPDEAIAYCRKAVELKPDDALANADLGNALRLKGRLEEAVAFYKRALELNPNVAAFHSSLANTLIEIGKVDEALPQFEIALQMDPSDALLMNNLAFILATCPNDSLRNGQQALELAKRAVQAIGDSDPTVLGTLAAAYAETGRFPEAILTEEKAYALASASGNAELTAWHAQLLNDFRAHQPYRESSLETK